MNRVNVYPVSFSNFLTIKSVGNYVIMYCILDDRIHFEMPVENSVFISQKFITDIEEEMKQKASNFLNDKLLMFLKMTLSSSTFYRYYPTDEDKEYIKSVKLYDNVIVKQIIVPGTYDKNNVKIFESDQLIKAYNGNDLIMEAEKVK